MKLLTSILSLTFYSILSGCQMNDNTNNLIIVKNLQDSNQSVRSLWLIDSSKFVIGGNNYSKEVEIEQKFWMQTCFSISQQKGEWIRSDIGPGSLVKITENADKLFALTVLGPDDLVNDTSIIYQSNNGGLSWTEFSRVPCYGTNIIFSANNNHNMYVLARDNPQVGVWQVFETKDFGKTWKKIISDNSLFAEGHIYKDTFYFFTYTDNSCTILKYHNGILSKTSKSITSPTSFHVQSAIGYEDHFYFAGQSNEPNAPAALYKFDIEKDTLQLISETERFSVNSMNINDQTISLFMAKAGGIGVQYKIVYSKDRGHTWTSIPVDEIKFKPTAFRKNKYVGYIGFGEFKLYEIP